MMTFDDAELIGRDGGSEASIDIYLMKRFPGIGGTIAIRQALSVAYRKEYNYSPQVGHKLFHKHSLIKKLDDYFFRRERYTFAHITRPVGSTDEGYIYEWVFGSESFPLSVPGPGGYPTPVDLGEFKGCVESFTTAGIYIGDDIKDPNGTTQNIIHQLYHEDKRINDPDHPRLSRAWKRIDFGSRSLRIDYEKLMRYLDDHRDDIIHALGTERLEMMELACRYLDDENSVTEKGMGGLERLAYNFRRSTLRHLNMRGFGSIDQEGEV